MATTATPAPSVEKVKKVYKYFDLSTFKEVKEEVEVPFKAPSDFSEAVQRLDNDQVKVLAALSAYLKRAAFSEAKRDIAKKGASKKVVLDLIRPMRSMEPWASIKERKEQTDALLELVRSTPALIESVKATSLKAAESDEDEDGNTDDES